jgi:hypothetical protein
MKYSILFLFLTYSIMALSQKNNEWKLTKNQDGIKIYMRKAASSKTNEVLGIMQMKTHLAPLVQMVKDSENHYRWIYANKNAKTLKVINDYEWIYYNESKAPWPVSNRDVITHALIIQDLSTFTVKIKSDGWPDYLPVKKDLVRIPALQNVWEFIPKKEGITEVHFTLAMDLGGDIPAWLVNMVIDNGPFSTIFNMSKLVQTDLYKNTYLSYIKEKSF